MSGYQGYQFPQDEHAMIESAFTFHPATTPEVQLAHEAVRDACRFVANEISNVCPSSPELTFAIRRIQEAMMYANSAIAQWGIRGQVGNAGKSSGA